MGFGDISGSNRATQATINAVGPAVALMLPVGGYGSAGFTLAAGTLAATIIPEVSFDGKDTWMPWELEDPQTGQKRSALTVTNPNPASSWTIHPPGGTTHTRINVTAYTSGSATAIRSAEATACDPTAVRRWSSRSGSARTVTSTRAASRS